MSDWNLQHPDITAAERTGYALGNEPHDYLECDWCGGFIYLGTEYYDIHGEILCASCVEDCKKEHERDW